MSEHPYNDSDAAIAFAVEHAGQEAHIFLGAWREQLWPVLDDEWPEWRPFVFARNARLQQVAA